METWKDRISEGMTVHTSDGKKLGRVMGVKAAGFTVEKGIFFIKDYFVRYDQIAGVDDDGINLLLAADELHPVGEADEATTGRGEASAAAATGTPDEVRVPLAEERLEAAKELRDVGDVSVHKRVVMEEKQITVPVIKEQVQVERHAVDPGAVADTEAFREETVRVPVREEEIEVRKRPVVREEVVLTRTPHVEQRTASAEVRREDIEIESTGEVSRRRKDDDRDV